MLIRDLEEVVKIFKAHGPNHTGLRKKVAALHFEYTVRRQYLEELSPLFCEIGSLIGSIVPVSSLDIGWKSAVTKSGD